MTDTTQIPPRRSTASIPPPRASSAPPAPGKQASGNPRKDAVLSVVAAVQMPLVAMATVETIRSSDSAAISPWAMDVFAIKQHEDAFASAMVELANSYPVLGAMLDKIAIASPFGAVFEAVVTIAAQISENHGTLPPVARDFIPGLIPREELARLIHEAATNGNTASE